MSASAAGTVFNVGLWFGWMIGLFLQPAVVKIWPSLDGERSGCLVALMAGYGVIYVPLLVAMLIGREIAAAPLLFVAIAGLAGAGFWARHRSNGSETRALALPAFILAGSLLPHFLFVAAFTALVRDGVEPSDMESAARAWEGFAVWLHEQVKPWLAMTLGVSLLLAGIAWLLAARTGSAAPLLWLKRWRTWSGRLSLAIIGTSAFTVFTGIPAGAWSPDTGARLTAQLRLGEHYRVEAALAKAMTEAVKADPLPLAQVVYPAAVAIAINAQTDDVGLRYGGSASIAEIAAEKTGVALAERLTPADDRETAAVAGAASSATLSQVRQTAGQAAAEHGIAAAARAEAKTRIAAAIARAADGVLEAAGMKDASELVAKLRDKLIDTLCDRAADGIMATAAADLSRPHGASAKLRTLAERVAVKFNADLAKPADNGDTATDFAVTTARDITRDAANEAVEGAKAQQAADDEQRRDRVLEESRPHIR